MVSAWQWALTARQAGRDGKKMAVVTAFLVPCASRRRNFGGLRRPNLARVDAIAERYRMNAARRAFGLGLATNKIVGRSLGTTHMFHRVVANATRRRSTGRSQEA
jgi:hypothetical protein